MLRPWKNKRFAEGSYEQGRDVTISNGSGTAYFGD
jgi:hypothetical protein